MDLTPPPRRPFGRTGLSISPIAFGAFKIGRNEKIKYAHHYPLPSEQESAHLLSAVLDLGINLIDTAPAYGLSEERIGRHLAPRRREFILSTKVGETFENGLSTYDFSRDAVERSVTRSLQRLRTDAVDLLLIHSGASDLQLLTETDLVETLLSLKQRGLTRFIGLSGKTPGAATHALAWADALMVEYHPDDRTHEPVLSEAAAKGLAVLIKKPLASGSLPPAQAIPFLLQNPAISTLVIGGLNLAHIRENLRLATCASPARSPVPP